MKKSIKDIVKCIDFLLTSDLATTTRKCGHAIKPEDILYDGDKVDLGKCEYCSIGEGIDYISKVMPNITKYKKVDFEKNRNKKIKRPYFYGVEIECFLSRKVLIHINRYFSNKLICEDIDSKAKPILIDLIKFDYEQEYREFEKKTTKILRSLGVSKEKFISRFIVSTDGSVRLTNDERNLKIFQDGVVAVEIKTNIFSGDAGIDYLKAFFDIFEPYFNSTCGLHVHVSEQERALEDPSSKYLDKCSLLGPLFSTFEIGEDIPFERHFYNYSVNELNSNPSYFLKRMAMGVPVGFNSAASHTNCVSCSNKGTFEFRMLHGNSDIELITRSINKFMDFVYIVKNITFTELIESCNKYFWLFDCKNPKNTKIIQLMISTNIGLNSALLSDNIDIINKLGKYFFVKNSNVNLFTDLVKIIDKRKKELIKNKEGKCKDSVPVNSSVPVSI